MARSKIYPHALANVRNKAASLTKCYAVADTAARTVLRVAPDAMAANVALCAHLDTFFEANPDASRHSFDIVPLSRPFAVGDTYDHADVVFTV